MKKEIILIMMVLFSIVSLTGLVRGDSMDYNRLDITLLNQDPDPGEQGEYLELRWKVVKEGNDKMEDLNFHLEIDYPFFFDNSDKPDKKVGSWQGWSDDEEYYSLYYKVRVDDEALEDTYKVKLRSTQESSGYSQMNEFEIKVGDKTNPEFVLGTLVTSPVKLLADSDENKLEVTLENIGDENARNVRMDLELPKGFNPTYGYSDRANLGTVEADKSKTAAFYVDIDDGMTQGKYEGKVTVHYKEANDNDNVYKTVELPLKIPINGKPSFSIESIKTIPEKIRAGSSVKLVVEVKNVGSKEAESVSLRAFKESSQPFEFEEKSDFIGKLKPGELGEAVLKFDVDTDATVKKYLLDLEIRSVYNDEVLTENEVITLEVENGEEKGLFSSGNRIIGFAIIAVIVIGGLVLYFVIKKKKEK